MDDKSVHTEVQPLENSSENEFQDALLSEEFSILRMLYVRTEEYNSANTEGSKATPVKSTVYKEFCHPAITFN